MALMGLLLGEVLDALQADETVVNTIHQQRPKKARQTDNREHAEKQTDDLHEWLAAPSQVDMTTIDTPAFAGEHYDPLKEFEDQNNG